MDVAEFLAAAEEFIRRHRLLTPRQAVLVAVSGGADSMALTEALRRLGLYRLSIGHVHHGLRPEADADAAFVADYARRHELPSMLERIDTPALAKAWGTGIEEAARRGRYEALGRMARSAGASAVAVAHHADDQVETVIQRLFRGTHLRGLCGMAPARPLAPGDPNRNESRLGTPGLALVRPLLWARRSQVEAFCQAAGLEWRTDHTNAQTDYTRNFIRHELLPLVRSRLNARADEAVLRLAATAQQAEELLAELADRLWERALRRASDREVVLRLSPLKKAPALLASAVLRRALAALNAPEQDLSHERFADLLEVVHGQAPAVDLPGPIHVRHVRQDVVLERP